jgi:hypothetical protein
MQEPARSCKNKIQLAGNIFQDDPTAMKTGKGHGPGKNNVHIGCGIPKDVDERLRRLAAASNMTRSAYAREAIQDAVAAAIVIGKTKHRANQLDSLGKPERPPQPAPIALGRSGTSMPAPMLNEESGTRYTAPRRGSRPAPSAP